MIHKEFISAAEIISLPNSSDFFSYKKESIFMCAEYFPHGHLSKGLSIYKSVAYGKVSWDTSQGRVLVHHT